jgi:hypothetical protein
MVEFVGQSMLTSRSFNIFPNPAHSTISIASNTSNFDYSIFDTSGRIMLSGKCKNDNQVIDVSEFLPGVYFIRIGEEMLRVVVF